MDQDESFLHQVSWWPIIAVLGTYSAGKSTFLNDYLDYKLQLTGDQAIDDKFTAICFSHEGTVRALPSLALDADPRFPFYRISQSIRAVSAGNVPSIDPYLQLKTCPSEGLRGKIFIDSPGFDADAQRTVVLQLSDHIIDLADLVLVFFDARHPEPGSMRDTLQHLVEKTIQRADSNKFLYILNIVDATAQEDNAEDVVAAWQRALSQKGLTAGRFYRIFSRTVAPPITDENVRTRYEAKRDADWADIESRMRQVQTEQAYRLVGKLEQTAQGLEKSMPTLQKWLRKWRTRLRWMDGLLGGITALIAGIILWAWLGEAAVSGGMQSVWLGGGVLLLCLLEMGMFHFAMCCRVADTITEKIFEEHGESEETQHLVGAFRHNTHWYWSLFHRNPVGWNQPAKQTLKKVRDNAGHFVQQLNDIYAQPSGHPQDSPRLQTPQEDAPEQLCNYSSPEE